MPPFYTEEEQLDEIRDILASAPGGLTEDAIGAVLAIRHERVIGEALEELILASSVHVSRVPDAPAGGPLRVEDFLFQSVVR